MLTAVITMSLIGLFTGFFLSIASKQFKVEVDPREEEILNILPMTNCGACGFPGCAAYAKALIKKEAAANGCVSGGSAVTEAVSNVIGVSVKALEKEVAVIMCKGTKTASNDKFLYVGIMDCKSAALVSGGPKSCQYGCIGFGTCKMVCPFDAIKMGDDGLPVVDEEKCTGCRICSVNCPKHLIKMLPVSNKIHIRCNSLDSGSVTRKNCTAGCIACRKCEKTCPYHAISLKEGLAIIDPLICVNCRECVAVCPTDSIENYFPGEKLCASEYKAEDK